MAPIKKVLMLYFDRAFENRAGEIFRAMRSERIMGISGQRRRPGRRPEVKSPAAVCHHKTEIAANYVNASKRKTLQRKQNGKQEAARSEISISKLGVSAIIKYGVK